MVGGGKTTVEIFDMLGRMTFSRELGELTRPVSFTIPPDGVPRSPFIAKVRDENGSAVRRRIPVR